MRQGRRHAETPRNEPVDVPRERARAVLSGAGNQALARMARQSPATLARVAGVQSAWETATNVVSEAVHGIAGQELNGSVGVGGTNDPGDVMIVERLLAAVGIDEADVGAAVARYQKDVLGWSKPDGRVDPGGRTFR